MLTQFVITVLLLISFIASLPIRVEGQSAYRFKVDVPFPFVLRGQTLPAGTYVIERTDPAKPNIVTLKRVDGGVVRVVITQRIEKDEPSSASSLIFIQRKGTASYRQAVRGESRCNQHRTSYCERRTCNPG